MRYTMPFPINWGKDLMHLTLPDSLSPLDAKRLAKMVETLPNKQQRDKFGRFMANPRKETP